MIINLTNNFKIIKEKHGIVLPDLTVLTGENGAGKTQLLEFLYHHSMAINVGMIPTDPNNADQKEYYPITDNDGKKLKEIIFMQPGIVPYDNGLPLDTGPTINLIRDHWDQLKPIANAYGSMPSGTYTIEEEVEQLNKYIIKIAQSLLINRSRFTDNDVIKVDVNQISLLKNLANQTKKKIDQLTFSDYFMFYPIVTQLFSSSIDLLFHQFHLKKKYYSSLTKNILPPWEVFNTILNDVSYNYRVEYKPSIKDEIPANIVFKDQKNKTSDAKLEALSSGEKTILNLIFALYHSTSNGKFPEVILFDEPDAHLHPSLAHKFISVVKDNIVEKQNVKVIITTHSPSTVAFAPVDSVYRMDRDLGYPVKEEKSKVIKHLTDGLITVTIDDVDLGIEYALSSTEMPVLFTEGITDKIIINTAWRKLYPGESQPFLIQDFFDAQSIKTLFKRGGDLQNGIFELYRDKIMIALFDFDEEGYNSWNNLNFEKNIELDPFQCLTKSNTKNAYAMLLPVPDIDEIKKQVIKSNSTTFKHESVLTIEHLLFNAPNFRTNHFEKDTVIGGGFSYKFKGKKHKFAKNAASLKREDFIMFIPLFNAIKKIINKK